MASSNRLSHFDTTRRNLNLVRLQSSHLSQNPFLNDTQKRTFESILEGLKNVSDLFDSLKSNQSSIPRIYPTHAQANPQNSSTPNNRSIHQSSSSSQSNIENGESMRTPGEIPAKLTYLISQCYRNLAKSQKKINDIILLLDAILSDKTDVPNSEYKYIFRSYQSFKSQNENLDEFFIDIQNCKKKAEIFLYNIIGYKQMENTLSLFKDILGLLPKNNIENKNIESVIINLSIIAKHLNVAPEKLPEDPFFLKSIILGQRSQKRENEHKEFLVDTYYLYINDKEKISEESPITILKKIFHLLSQKVPPEQQFIYEILSHQIKSNTKTSKAKEILNKLKTDIISPRKRKRDEIEFEQAQPANNDERKSPDIVEDLAVTIINSSNGEATDQHSLPSSNDLRESSNRVNALELETSSPSNGETNIPFDIDNTIELEFPFFQPNTDINLGYDIDSLWGQEDELNLPLDFGE